MRTSYRDLTVSEYGRIIGVLKAGGDDVTVRLYAICAGITEVEAGKVDLSDFIAGLGRMDFLKVSPFEGMKPLRGGYVLIGGRRYCITAKKGATAGQYIDMQAVLKRREELPADELLVSVLSVCLVPDGCVYGEGYDFEEVRRDVGSMSVDQAVGVFAFFLRQSERLMRRSLTYSIPLVAGAGVTVGRRVRLMRRIFQTLRDLRRSGVGGYGLMR